MHEKFTFPVVSVIIEHLDLSGRILLQTRTKGEPPRLRDLWEPPQGRLRIGESLLDCAVREREEETGLHGLQLRSCHESWAVLGGVCRGARPSW